jgi:hypothetical protein
VTHRTTDAASVGKTINYLRQATSGAAGNGLGSTIKYLRSTTRGAAGNGLGATIKYLRHTHNERRRGLRPGHRD